MVERSGIFQFGGKDVTVVGNDIVVGQSAPDFIVQDIAYQNFSPLAESEGKVRIFAALPSLDTSVCDRETRRFNEEAARLSKDIAIYIISTDLPATQKKWCGAAGVDQVKTVSDHMDTNFGVKYGTLLKEVRVFRRSVFVVDRTGKVSYVDYMPANSVEPDYEAVLQAAVNAL